MTKGNFFSNKNNQRTTQVVNGAWALWVGVGSLPAILFLIYLYVSWLYDILFNGKEFIWSDFVCSAWVAILFIGVTYSLIRIGYEELTNGSKSGGRSFE